ncbi:hypothetical protein FACS1894191_4380 [Clostridia bacterium]|nr:hypothetical protein FACS1894191_4380 [Clostridia bacterium]
MLIRAIATLPIRRARVQRWQTSDFHADRRENATGKAPNMIFIVILALSCYNYMGIISIYVKIGMAQAGMDRLPLGRGAFEVCRRWEEK